MSGYEAYKDYVALKQHFSRFDYDYIKYGGKSRTKHETYEKRKDKIFFEKVGKRADYHDFLLANLSHDSKLWIKDIAYSDDAEKRFSAWKKRKESLTYMFKSELSKLDENFDANFICKDGQHPKLLTLFLAGEISMETICILLDITGAAKHWNKQLEYDLVWDECKLKLLKYIPFLQYDREKFKKLALDFFS